jgi:hypothetical protein
MKRCPNCDKTFDDNLKFCQVDGTPLVEDAAETVDPFKTMVASKSDIAAAMSSIDPPAKADKPGEPPALDEQVLEIPEPMDMGKTQVVSESELRAEMAKTDADNEPVIDIPPMEEAKLPEPVAPKFNEPKINPPKFESESISDDRFTKTTPPIPSPFADAKPTAMEAPTDEPPSSPFSAPEPPSPLSVGGKSQAGVEDEPKFADPEPAISQFEPEAEPAAEPLAQAQWSPPAAQESNMQNPQNFGQNQAPAAAAGPSSVLAIVSLVVGILSILCCGWFIPGIVAIVLGFMARSKANSDPANYGGAGLALGGIITGALSLVLGVIVIVLYVFFGVGAQLLQGM